VEKKDHTVKNNIIFGDQSSVISLSPTHEGKKHDVTVCREEKLEFKNKIILRVDSGYQGLEIENVTIIIPHKKPKNKKLTNVAKDENRKKSKERVIAEHGNAGIKRIRVLKDRLRLKLLMYRDLLMVIGCALHNFRVKSPFRAYATKTN
jgi:IS5 family transposase